MNWNTEQGNFLMEGGYLQGRSVQGPCGVPGEKGMWGRVETTFPNLLFNWGDLCLAQNLGE